MASHLPCHDRWTMVPPDANPSPSLSLSLHPLPLGEAMLGHPLLQLLHGRLELRCFVLGGLGQRQLHFKRAYAVAADIAHGEAN